MSLRSELMLVNNKTLSVAAPIEVTLSKENEPEKKVNVTLYFCNEISVVFYDNAKVKFLEILKNAVQNSIFDNIYVSGDRIALETKIQLGSKATKELFPPSKFCFEGCILYSKEKFQFEKLLDFIKRTGGPVNNEKYIIENNIIRPQVCQTIPISFTEKFKNLITFFVQNFIDFPSIDSVFSENNYALAKTVSEIYDKTKNSFKQNKLEEYKNIKNLYSMSTAASGTNISNETIDESEEEEQIDCKPSMSAITSVELSTEVKNKLIDYMKKIEFGKVGSELQVPDYEKFLIDKDTEIEKFKIYTWLQLKTLLNNVGKFIGSISPLMTPQAIEYKIRNFCLQSSHSSYRINGSNNLLPFVFISKMIKDTFSKTLNKVDKSLKANNKKTSLVRCHQARKNTCSSLSNSTDSVGSINTVNAGSSTQSFINDIQNSEIEYSFTHSLNQANTILNQNAPFNYPRVPSSTFGINSFSNLSNSINPNFTRKIDLPSVSTNSFSSSQIFNPLLNNSLYPSPQQTSNQIFINSIFATNNQINLQPTTAQPIQTPFNQSLIRSNLSFNQLFPDQSVIANKYPFTFNHQLMPGQKI